MKVLKNRGAAAAITAVVIVLATLFGVHRSVAAQVKKTEQAFYDGVYLADGGYTETSIASQLGQRSNAANGLLSIAAGVDSLAEEAGELMDARNALMDADGISELYAANARLQAAYETLYPLLLEQELPENKLAALKSYASTMDGAQGVIDRSGYNGLVDEFCDTILGSFPVSLLKYPALAGEPERFG